MAQNGPKMVIELTKTDFFQSSKMTPLDLVFAHEGLTESTKLKLKNTSPPKSNEEISSKSDEPVEKKGLQLLKNPTLSKISYD